MNKERICCVRGVFQGLYAWGDGWSSVENARKWDEYLANYKGNYWRPIRSEDNLSCWTLVSIEGSIYFHPMDFRTVLRSSGGKTNGNTKLEQYFGDELRELKQLCQEIAELCGGKLSTFIAETQEVENNNFVNLLEES